MLLDLLLSLITFIAISIKDFVGYFVFRPPNPMGYRIQVRQVDDEIREKVLILKRGKRYLYESVEFSTLKHDFIKIPDDNGSFIPCIIIKPNNYYNLCIIYSHGNSCDIGISFYECVDISLNTNSCVLIYEYPDYGLCSNKKLTEEAIYHNIRKTYNYARNNLQFKPEDIVVYGHSLGTGPSIDLAIDDKYPLAGIILQAPFLSILRTVAVVKSTLFFDYFPNIDKIHKIKSPILIIHGTNDNIVSMSDGEKLSKCVQDNLLYEFFKVPEAGHNDIIKNYKVLVYKKIREFFSHITNINFDIISEDTHTKNNEINSDFFRKMHPQCIGNKLGDDLPEEEFLSNIDNEKYIHVNIENQFENENDSNKKIEIEFKHIKIDSKDFVSQIKIEDVKIDIINQTNNV